MVERISQNRKLVSTEQSARARYTPYRTTVARSPAPTAMLIATARPTTPAQARSSCTHTTSGRRPRRGGGPSITITQVRAFPIQSDRGQRHSGKQGTWRKGTAPESSKPPMQERADPVRRRRLKQRSQFPKHSNIKSLIARNRIL
jgi:hypothetical protein